MSLRPRVNGLRRSACTLALLALSSGAAAESADSPRAWLDRMSRAMEDLNYQGTVVHVHDGQSDVFEIVHRAEGGRRSERITSRDDAGREIIRNDSELTCIFPDRHEVVVEKLGGGGDSPPGPLRQHLPQAGQIDETLYHVAFDGAERIGGRATRVLAIRPKDTWRYGYRVWLDEASAMPLKTELLDETGQMLEQVRFTSIVLPERIPESAVRPTVSVDSFVWERSAGPAQETPSDQAGAEWRAARLPPGFRLTDRHARFGPDFPGGLRQLVYSDGLASISVFIEMEVAASEQVEGPSRIGAANAFTTMTAGHMVTAVGEVPERTVALIAGAMRPPRGAARP